MHSALRGNAVHDAPRRLRRAAPSAGAVVPLPRPQSGNAKSRPLLSGGASPGLGARKTTRSVGDGIPTRSVGTSVICLHNWKPGSVCHPSVNRCKESRGDSARRAGGIERGPRAVGVAARGRFAGLGRSVGEGWCTARGGVGGEDQGSGGPPSGRVQFPAACGARWGRR